MIAIREYIAPRSGNCETGSCDLFVLKRFANFSNSILNLFYHVFLPLHTRSAMAKLSKLRNYENNTFYYIRYIYQKYIKVSWKTIEKYVFDVIAIGFNHGLLKTWEFPVSLSKDLFASIGKYSR